jgi:hypothetical protein
MAVDDAGRRRQEGAQAGELGFHSSRLVAADPFEIGDAVRLRLAPHAVEDRQLRFLGGDGELAEPAVRDTALAAIGIEPVTPGDA